MRKSALLLLATLGCVSKGTDIPPLVAGNGMKVDSATNTVSVDTGQVPLLPSNCTSGQIVTRGNDAWICADAATNAINAINATNATNATNALNATNATNAVNATHAATATDADTLDSMHAADMLASASASFLGITAQAADAARLGGFPPGHFATASAGDGVADNANALGGKAASQYLSLNAAGDYAPQGDIALSSSRHASIYYRPLRCSIGYVCGGTISVSGRFCGLAAPVTGALTWNSGGVSASGYMAGKKICEGVSGCASADNLAHMCDAQEIARSLQIGDGFSGPAWYAPGIANDCNGWTDGTSSSYGTIWTPPYGASPCSASLPIACCL